MLRTILRALVALAAVGFALFAYVYVTLPDVRELARKNPTTTAFMELRAREAAAAGKRLRHVHRWVPYGRISPNLKQAVLAAEDDGFFDHDGIDIESMKDAMEESIEKGTIVRGGSTITQQLAKNLYLSPSQDPLRKLKEVIIARRMEAALTKARIFEIYLNVVEWGDGIWGAEAAARTYFRTSAASLTRDQAALLAGALINPRRYSPARPPARLLRRQRIIMSRMGGFKPPAPEAVVIPPTEMPPPGVNHSDDEPAREMPPATDEPATIPPVADEAPVQDSPAPTQPPAALPPFPAP